MSFDLFPVIGLNRFDRYSFQTVDLGFSLASHFIGLTSFSFREVVDCPADPVSFFRNQEPAHQFFPQNLKRFVVSFANRIFRHNVRQFLVHKFLLRISFFETFSGIVQTALDRSFRKFQSLGNLFQRQLVPVEEIEDLSVGYGKRSQCFSYRFIYCPVDRYHGNVFFQRHGHIPCPAAVIVVYLVSGDSQDPRLKSFPVVQGVELLVSLQIDLLQQIVSVRSERNLVLHIGFDVVSVLFQQFFKTHSRYPSFI